MINNFKKFIPQKAKKNVKVSLNRIKYRLESKKDFKRKESPSLILIGTPNYGNLGDHAIAEAEVEFLTSYFSDYKLIEISMHQYEYSKKIIQDNINSEDLILVHGGGFLGSLWIEGEEMFRNILESFPNNDVVIFPQTIYFEKNKESQEQIKISKSIYEKHKNLTIFARDEKSFKFLNSNMPNITKVLMVPDIVTFLEPKLPVLEREDILLCLRSDKEKITEMTTIEQITTYLNKRGYNFRYTDTVIEQFPNKLNRKIYLNKKFNEFRKSKLVVTDRLHGMIFSLITGTPCLAMNNSSGKVKGVYQWLKSVDYIQVLNDDSATDSNELEKVISDLLNFTNQEYSSTFLEDDFAPLIEEINIKINGVK